MRTPRKLERKGAAMILLAINCNWFWIGAEDDKFVAVFLREGPANRWAKASKHRKLLRKRASSIEERELIIQLAMKRKA